MSTTGKLTAWPVVALVLAGCAGPRLASTGADVRNAWGPVRTVERPGPHRSVDTPEHDSSPARVERRTGPAADEAEPSAVGADAPLNDAPTTACTAPLENATPRYMLPYALGDAFYVRQATCGRASHRGRFSFSYDFDMPRGTPVLAARDGVVSAVVTHHPENTNRSEHANYVVVRHEDGESSRYLHLRTGGATVDRGDRVRAGDRIAFSGNSGRSGRPHLHFDVIAECERGPCPTVPATFLNAEHRAPRAGRSYRAVDQR